MLAFKTGFYLTEKACKTGLILLHSERPKLYAILAFLSAIGLTVISLDGVFTYYNGNTSITLWGMGILSWEAILPFSFSLPSQVQSTLKGKIIAPFGAVFFL